jgi:TIR domain
MNRAVQTTRQTLLVLSPAYLRSQMAEAEWRPGFVADPSGEERRLLPVRVEPCEVEGLLADRVYVDLVGLDEATCRATLLDGVTRALRGPGPPATRPRFPKSPAAAVDRPRFPSALPPVWNVPFRRNPDFTGRDAELAGLAAALEQGERVAVTQVLQGGGGVGKTALATEYAYRQRTRFDTVWWVRAEEPTILVGDYTDLAIALGLVASSEADQQVAAIAVRRWLEGRDRWLLIFDNAEAPDASTGLEPPLDMVWGCSPR